MNPVQKLEENKVYHIYNCGNNHENLFTEESNYIRFLNLYEKYIDPIAYTYAWVLMPNHFHILVKMKSNLCYRFNKSDFISSPEDFELFKWETRQQNKDESLNNKIPDFNKHFSHLFNAYAKYFNINTGRSGVLFKTEFSRKLITNRKYFKNVLIYIHQNPINHGFCDNILDYPWTSYFSSIDINPTKLRKDVIMRIFNGKSEFISQNNSLIDFEKIDNYLFSTND